MVKHVCCMHSRMCTLPAQYGPQFARYLPALPPDFCAAAHQVFVHTLRKVDMRAVVGQSCSTSLAVGGGLADRQVAVYSSHPLALQASPQQLTLPAGRVSALSLVFSPLEPGQEWVRQCPGLDLVGMPGEAIGWV